MEITIPWKPVKALLQLAGKEDIRPYLNGVWIDRQAPHLIAWATTGHILGAVQTEEPSTEGPDVFLPRHIVEACKDFTVQATVKQEADGRMSISCMGTSHYWQDAKFAAVDWRRVVARGKAGERAEQFDATLLAPFVKVRETLCGKKGSTKVAGGVLIAHNPDGMLVTLLDAPHFVGVLMPLRDEVTRPHIRTVAPDWVRERGRLPAEAADLV